MTVVVYAVGCVLILAAVAAGPGSKATFAPIVVVATALAGVGVVALLWRRATLERALSAIRSAQSVVASGRIDPQRADVSELIGELRRIGFEMVGATDTLIGAGQPIRTWIMTENRGLGTTWVEVGVTRAPIAIFLSRAGDGRFLETVYPDGATIDHPNVFTRPIETSVSDALAAHRHVLTEWTTRSGPPLAVRTLHDYRHVESEIRERTGGLLLAAHIERVVEPGLRRWAMSAAIGLVTILGLVVLTALRP